MLKGLGPVEAVLYDKDGTLFDFQKTWAPWAKQVITRLAQGDPARLQHIAKVLGYDYAQGIFEADSMSIACTPLEQVEALCPVLPHMSPSEIQSYFEAKGINATPALIPNLRHSLQALKHKGVAMGVVTNDFEIGCRAQLAQTQLIDFFDVVIGFDSGFGGKPAPGGCLAACDALQCDPKKTLMVGDSLHDLHAGRAAGMMTVAVLTGTAKRADLAPYADLIVQDASELSNYL